MVSSRIARIAALAAAACPVASLRFDHGTNGTGPIRHLFVAGTMGTGLEFWQGLLKECVNAKICETRDPAFYTTVMYQTGDERTMKKMWGKNRPKSGALVPMNLISPSETYPDALYLHPFSGETIKGNEDPELNVYQRAANEYGDSFKVLVLTRGSETDLLHSMMRRWKHMSREEVEEMEAKNIRKIASQVRLLPAGSYRCQRYEDLMAYAPHIHPMLNVEYGSGRGEDVVTTAHTNAGPVNGGCKKLMKKGGKKCPEAPKLRAALDELESLCQPRDVGTQGVTVSDLRDQQSAYAGKVQWLLSY